MDEVPFFDSQGRQPSFIKKVIRPRGAEEAKRAFTPIEGDERQSRAGFLPFVQNELLQRVARGLFRGEIAERILPHRAIEGSIASIQGDIGSDVERSSAKLRGKFQRMGLAFPEGIKKDLTNAMNHVCFLNKADKRRENRSIPLGKSIIKP